MRGTVHHEYRQMPLRMKFCASFPVAPKGRGNGAFSFFVMQKHNKNHRRTDFAAESPSLFRDVRPRSAVCLFGCRVAASAANRCPKRFQKILFQCSTGLGKCQRPSDGKTGRNRRAIPTGFSVDSGKGRARKLRARPLGRVMEPRRSGGSGTAPWGTPPNSPHTPAAAADVADHRTLPSRVYRVV